MCSNDIKKHSEDTQITIKKKSLSSITNRSKPIDFVYKHAAHDSHCSVYMNDSVNDKQTLPCKANDLRKVLKVKQNSDLFAFQTQRKEELANENLHKFLTISKAVFRCSSGC